MNIHDVLEVCGGTKYALAKKLGITKQAISKWGDDVPPLRQLQIEELTGGKLKADRSIVFAGKKAA